MGMAADRGRDTFIKIKLYQLFTGRNSVQLVQQLKSRFIIWRDELHFRLSPQQRRMFISQFIANLCHHIRMGGIHINYNGLAGRYRNRNHPIVILPEYVSFTKASGKDIRIQPDSDFQSRTRRFLMKPFIRFMPIYFQSAKAGSAMLPSIFSHRIIVTSCLRLPRLFYHFSQKRL